MDWFTPLAETATSLLAPLSVWRVATSPLNDGTVLTPVQSVCGATV